MHDNWFKLSRTLACLSPLEGNGNDDLSTGGYSYDPDLDTITLDSSSGNDTLNGGIVFR
jgi:hypothetical protein